MFKTEELKEIISLYAEVIIDQGEIVCEWRDPLAKKFSKLPGIRNLHDFVYTASTSGVIAKVRRLCSTGLYEQSSSHVLRGRDVDKCIIPDPVDHNYSTLGILRPLTDSKLKHLKQMARDFIPSDRRLSFLHID